MQIKLLVMDVDGTLTDGKIYMGANGELMKAFDIKDGCGIKDILPTLGIIPVIITARQSQILDNRCKELNIVEVHQGIRNKLEKLKEICQRYGITFNQVAYMGDDILDLQCMKPIKEEGGIIGCPADAVKQVLATADFISIKDGGNGAVREFVEYLRGI
jgi:3-deoxy-D-manno-octulosonate 8-phosphate phosphatase (KDO 8-P phosphatase)